MTRLSVCKQDRSVPGIRKFTYTNGKVLVCDLSLLSKEMYAYAADEGVGHTIHDTSSGAAKANPKDPVGWAYTTACERWELILNNGEWHKGTRVSDGGILAEALARVPSLEGTLMSLAECQEKVKAMSDEKKADLRKKLDKIIKKIQLERAEAKPTAEVSFEDLEI